MKPDAKRTLAALRRLAKAERRTQVALLAGDITRAEAIRSLRVAAKASLESVVTEVVRSVVSRFVQDALKREGARS